MIHGLLYTLVAFLPQKVGRVGFVHLEVMIHHGREHVAGVGVMCVCSQGVERDGHGTDSLSLSVCSATLVCGMELPAVLSVWLNLSGNTDRGVCPGVSLQWSLGGSEDGPPVWTNLCGQ